MNVLTFSSPTAVIMSAGFVVAVFVDVGFVFVSSPEQMNTTQKVLRAYIFSLGFSPMG